MKTNYEQHRESAKELGATEGDLAAARELLQEAEGSHKKASEQYERVIEEGKAEAPGLVAEAYDEYFGLLKQEANNALEANDFEKLESLTKEMRRNQEAYEMDERLLPQDVQASVEELMKSHGVRDRIHKDHYMNRARRLVGDRFPVEEIEKRLKAEMEEPNPAIRLNEGPYWRGARHPKKAA
jgi:hypothetical protein